MSVILLPDDELFRCPAEFSVQFLGNTQGLNVSPLNGAAQTVEFPGDRRIFRMQYGPIHGAYLPTVRAYWNRFRGQVNVLRIWNLVQPVPLGTLRGSPTLNAAASEGANSVVIAGDPGETLLVGDWIGITLADASVYAVEVATVSGTGTITVGINPPLPKDANSGAAVKWDKPTVDCLLTAAPVIPHGAGSRFQMGMSDGFSVEAIEFFS